jgi:hypothetical protein
MAFVWQIREKNSGLWVRDSSQGWHILTDQDDAYLWRRQDLAEKALKVIQKRLRSASDTTTNVSTWYKGFEQYLGNGKTKIYKKLDFEIVCSKLVYAETVLK